MEVVKLRMAEGGEIWVNPDAVVAVEPAGEDQSRVIVKGGRTLTVLGDAREVVKTLDPV
jgi:hypothetical protein